MIDRKTVKTLIHDSLLHWAGVVNDIANDVEADTLGQDATITALREVADKMREASE